MDDDVMVVSSLFHPDPSKTSFHLHERGVDGGGDKGIAEQQSIPAVSMKSMSSWTPVLDRCRLSSPPLAGGPHRMNISELSIPREASVASLTCQDIFDLLRQMPEPAHFPSNNLKWVNWRVRSAGASPIDLPRGERSVLITGFSISVARLHYSVV